MSKKFQTQDVMPPSLTKEQGKTVLAVMKEKGEQLIKQRPISEESFDTWSQSTFEYIKKIYGSESDFLSIFAGQGRIQFGNPSESYLERTRAESLTKRISVLSNLIEELVTAIALEAPSAAIFPLPDQLIWTLLHAKVVTAARPRFEAGQYADAVEAALKELNSEVKEMIRKKTGQELDGASLMQKAFSPNLPVLIVLDDLSTESGRNVQQGYMQIFAGAMIGIRNPKAHENLTITRERAIHHLFLASLLFKKLDERP